MDVDEETCAVALDSPDFFTRDAVEVARGLVGMGLFVNDVGGLIVETEAYRQDDRASHSFRGSTPRCRTMFGPPGHAYIYCSHGLHWCFNIVCLPGSAVLVRALEPRLGLARMVERRAYQKQEALCSGPGRLCQALDIDGSLDGKECWNPPFRIVKPLEKRPSVIATTRIGISKDVDRPWRFCAVGSKWLSRRPR